MATPDSSRGRPRRARGVPIPPQADARNVPPRAVVARAFGAALRELRTARRVSQEALADAAGLDRTYPSLLERGLRVPTLTAICHLADALGVDPSQLVGRAVDGFANAGG